MSLQIEYFLNHCRSLIVSSLDWLSNPQKLEKAPSFPDFANYVETFIEVAQDLFETAEYDFFANDPALLLLKKLYSKIEDYSIKEELLHDPKWIEIQKLAKETSEALNLFIKKLS